MKAGRNDPCPCGSGKKYKKCCLNDQEAPSSQPALTSSPPSSAEDPRPAPFLTRPHSKPAGPTAPGHAAKAQEPSIPPDPITERANSLWDEFQSQEGEARIAVFVKTLEDAEVMTDDMAFEMLMALHGDAVKCGNRTRFAECVGTLRERRPEVYDEGAHFYLSWRLQDALAENRQEVVPSLAYGLAACAGRDIDTFNRAKEILAYHGRLSDLVQAMRIAWPLVKSSSNVVPWGVTDFADEGANYEIFNYLEHTASPAPDDAVLLDRVKFFIADPREDFLREFIGDLMGKSGREWQADDFSLRPSRKSYRDAWDDDAEDESQPPDPGACNLSRLITAFVGYLRREEGVPFPRGGLVMEDLSRYFLRRHEGDLDPRPSMMEAALHHKRKLPKPPRPAHPLCPERVTFDVHLGTMMGPLNGLYHSAAALFQAMPAWLRFLESRRLIDAKTRIKVTADLLPLQATLLRIWEQHTEDPLLYLQGKERLA